MVGKGLSENMRAKLKSLRARLELAESTGREQGGRPAAEASRYSFEEEQMLSLILSDVLNGVDITEAYPAFYQLLRANVNLRASFLEALEILEKSIAGELAPLPGSPSRDLGFLQIASPAQTVEQSAEGAWRITWTQAVEQLSRLLLAPPISTGLAYRSAIDFFEEVPFTLFQSEIELDDSKVTALLEAVQSIDEPEFLRLALLVAIGGDLDEENRPGKLRAELQWGDYHASVPVEDDGRAVFPPVPLSTVLDEAREQVQANLQLTLEANAAET